MKKLTCFLVLLLVFSCVCMTVQAQETLPVTGRQELILSEDYQTVIWDGREYVLFDKAGVELVRDNYWDAELTRQQKQTLKQIQVYQYNRQTVMELDIYFLSGAHLNAYYLQKDLIADRTAILTGQAQDCRVDFVWPKGNIVQTRRESLMGKAITLNQEILNWCDSYDVRCLSGGLEITTGAVLHYEGSFYYIDLSSNGIEIGSLFYPGSYTSLSGWKVTDDGLLEELETGLEANYSDGLGIFDDDSLTEAISRVFMVMVFGILPGAIFVVFLILSLRAAQRVYRRLFRIVWALALAQVTVFAILMTILW